MNRLRAFFALPLLAKELTEAAARRRTYIIRVIYATLLYLTIGCSEGARHYAADPQAVLGKGWYLLEALSALQFAGIFLFMPALMAGAITIEKERGSLALLLLTRMTPGQILAEKYLSGLVLMTSFLLLGLPVLGICYAFGGVEAPLLCVAGFALFLAMLQSGAVALFCSTWCRTTSAAFLSTYLVGGVLYSAPRVFEELTKLWGYLSFHQFAPEDDGILFSLKAVFPPLLMDATLQGTVFSVRHMLLLGLPAIVSTAFFLFLARISFLPRAFALPRHRLLAAFRWLDAAFLRANRRMGNVVFGRQDRTLPADQPIAWREMTQKRMGRPNYLFRLLLIIEVPTIVALLCVTLTFDAGVLSIIAAITGSIAVLAIAVHGSNAFVAERANQTLDVLLTTPLRAAEIVRQKAAVMQRFVWVVSAPVATAFAYRAALQAGGLFTFNREENSALLYAVCATLTLAVYLPLVSWLSIGVGLAIRTRFRTIVVTLIVLVVWCALPIYVALGIRGFNNDTATRMILCASPLALPGFNEQNELRALNYQRPWVPVLANFAVYGALLSGIRRGCLRWADPLLRR